MKTGITKKHLTGLALVAALALAALLTLTDPFSVRAGDPHSEVFSTLPDPADPAAGETVATVDGVAITLGKLQGTMALARSAGQAVPAQGVLDSLIEYELLYAEGLRRGLAPSDDEVARAIEETRKNLDPAAVQAAVDYAAKGAVNMTVDEYWSHPTYRDGIRKSITVGNARDALQGAADAQAADRLAEGVSALRARANIVVNESVLEKAR